MLRSLAVLCVSGVLPIAMAAGSVVPAGTNVEVRLVTPVGSRLSHAGDSVTATVIAPVTSENGGLVLDGATLSGVVESVQPAGLGLRHACAALQLRFLSIRLTDGSEYSFQARVHAIETARERVDAEGRVLGIDPAMSLSSGVSFLMSTVLIHSELEVPAFAIKLLTARAPDYEIYLPAGAELFVELTHDLALGESHASGALPEYLSFADLSEVRNVLRNLPEQRAELSSHRSADLLNVVLLGTRHQVNTAFHLAGWSGECRHSPLALYRLFHSLVQRMGYQTAPMSRLRLNGLLADASFQKSLDTLAKRHHVRFWQQQGINLWLGAATEDVGFTVRNLHVSHAIDPDIDNERSKVANDLWLTGCVQRASMLRRENLRVLGRDNFSTSSDGDVVVLRLGNCKASGISADKQKAAHGRLQAAFTAVGLDFVRANPLTVSVTVARTFFGMVHPAHPPATLSVARTSVVPPAPEQMVQNGTPQRDAAGSN